MTLRAGLLMPCFVVACASCGGSAGAPRAATSSASEVPATTTTAPGSAPRTQYTAPPIADSAFPDRVWYPDLDTLATAVDDIVVATVADVGPLQPVRLPDDPAPSGLSARTVTLAVEQNLLHPTDEAVVTLYDGVLGDRADRNPLTRGQRVLAFLARVREKPSQVTHGMADYLMIDGNDTLVAATAALTKGRGASFLDGQLLSDVITAIRSPRPSS